MAAETRPSSSMKVQKLVKSAPAPPFSSGKWAPRIPIWPRDRKTSRGNLFVSSMGLTYLDSSSWAKRLTASRNMTCS